MTGPRVVSTDKGLFTFEPTNDPTVWFVESQTGSLVYRMSGFLGTGGLSCKCPAKARPCKHILAGRQLDQALMAEAAGVMNNDADDAKKPEPDDEAEITSEEIDAPPATEERGLVVSNRSTSSIMAARTAGVLSSQQLEITSLAYVGAYRNYLALADGMWLSGIHGNAENKPALASILMKAAELGVPPMTALELFYVVNGRVAVMAAMQIALVERSGKGWLEIVETTEEYATVRGYRPGRAVREVTWTQANALAAGTPLSRLTGAPIGGWIDKLKWKAAARVCRDLFADVLGGMDVGDVDGDVIDSSVVPLRIGEYLGRDSGVYQGDQKPAHGPANPEPPKEPPKEPEPPRETVSVPWQAEFKTALAAAGFKVSAIGRYFNKPEMTGAEMIKAIDSWIGAQPGVTASMFVSRVADWLASNTAPPAPIEPQADPPAAAQEPDPDDIFAGTYQPEPEGVPA